MQVGIICSRACRRRSRCTPVAKAADKGVLVAMRFSMTGVEMQGPALFVEAAPKPAIKGDIAHQIVAQHAASPGQGCAICCNIGTSTLAWMAVVSGDWCRNIVPMA